MMRTLRFFTLIFCIVIALVTPSMAEEARPNILFLLSDDQRADALYCARGAYAGNTYTPNLDDLAANGIRFGRNFTTTAICAVSRASIMSGQYARRHGIHDFATTFSQEQWAETYPAILRAAGYRTGFIGKYGIGTKLPADAFDYFRGFADQGSYWNDIDGNRVHHHKIVADQAAEFLGTLPRDKPFCLSISFKSPHTQDGQTDDPFPMDPEFESRYAGMDIPPAPKSDPAIFEALPDFIRNSEGRLRWEFCYGTKERYEKSVRGYFSLIAGMDATIGRIRAKLDALGLAKNTVIIFTSDNGFFLGERGLQGKWLMYEESIRTPMIIYDPRMAEQLRGLHLYSMTLNIDVAPTILEIAGTPIPARMQGRSLMPFVNGTIPSDWRTEFFYEHLYAHGGKIPATEGIRTREWKYTRYVGTDPPYEELFDLKNDPEEMENVLKGNQGNEVQDLMRARWQDLRERLK